MSVNYKEQGVGKIVNILFPTETRASSLGAVLCIRFNTPVARNGKTNTFIWSQDLNHTVVADELHKLVEKHSAQISFTEN